MAEFLISSSGRIAADKPYKVIVPDEEGDMTLQFVLASEDGKSYTDFKATSPTTGEIRIVNVPSDSLSRPIDMIKIGQLHNNANLFMTFQLFPEDSQGMRKINVEFKTEAK